MFLPFIQINENFVDVLKTYLENKSNTTNSIKLLKLINIFDYLFIDLSLRNKRFWYAPAFLYIGDGFWHSGNIWNVQKFQVHFFLENIGKINEFIKAGAYQGKVPPGVCIHNGAHLF